MELILQRESEPQAGILHFGPRIEFGLSSITLEYASVDHAPTLQQH